MTRTKTVGHLRASAVSNNNGTIKSIDTLTDDDIIAAIAECGVFGIDLGTDADDDNEPSGEAVVLAMRLCLIGDEREPEDAYIVRRLISYIWMLENNHPLVEAHLGTTICLSLDYWAERLANKTKAQCRRILYTGQS